MQRIVLAREAAVARKKPATAGGRRSHGWAVQSPVRQSKLADQLYEQILDRIVGGGLAIGGKLPSESQLGELFGVSRPVVREALSRLQADGVVMSRHGSGSYVQRRPNQAFALLAPIGDVANLMRCMEFRIALEGEAASLAARRRTEADLARLEKALAELEIVMASGEVGVEADREFHVAIAAATQNQLFVHAMEVFSEQTLKGMQLARSLSLRRSAERLRLVQQEHNRIFEAIKAEDPVLARDAMRSHIDNARIRVLTDSTEP
jgi:GntR family transcriptional regulator, transcriptional repressor for pyruvate dehydrogenase complex